MANVPVKWMSSLMTGAPQITHAYGQLVALLDACLVTGFNLKVVQSITRVGNVATVTFSTAHGYVKDQVVNIYDCAQAEYSGDQRVVSATTNSFTFEVTGTPVTPGTSSADSIKCKVAPLGYEIQFSSANRRIYRSADLTGNRNVLRVDNDAPAGWNTNFPSMGKVHIARSATDVDTLNEFFPITTAGTSFPDIGWWKWFTSTFYASYTSNSFNNNTNQKSWVLVGDSKAFYLFLTARETSSFSARVGYGFGEFPSFKALDQYNTFLWAVEGYASTVQSASENSYGPGSARYQGVNIYASGEAILRAYTGVGSGVSAPKVTLGTANSNSSTYLLTSGLTTGIAWPNPIDYSLILAPSYVGEYNTGLRGIYPGYYAILNNVSTLVSDLQIIDNVSNYPGRKFLIVSCASGSSNFDLTSPRVALDIIGPWR